MNKRLLIMLFFGFFILSCKKQKTIEPVPIEPISFTTPDTSAFYGILQAYNYIDFPSENHTSHALAYFSYEPVNFVNTATTTFVRNVSLNNDSLGFHESFRQYAPLTTVNLSSEIWSVNGSDYIPSFSFTNTTVFPGCDMPLTMPDSVSKALGFTISINNAVNTTNGYLFIGGNSNLPTSSYTVAINPGNTTLTITPANLSTVANGSNVRLIAVLQNSISVNFSGKNFKFIHETEYRKNIKLKP